MNTRELAILQCCLNLVRALGERSDLDWMLEDQGLIDTSEDELDLLNAKLNRLRSKP